MATNRLPPTTFTGGAHSDHLPVVARLALVKERPPSEFETKINPVVFDNRNTRTITKLIWQKQIEKHPHETHGYAKGWAAAKSAVATYLLWESNEHRLKRRVRPLALLIFNFFFITMLLLPWSRCLALDGPCHFLYDGQQLIRPFRGAGDGDVADTLDYDRAFYSVALVFF